MVCNDDDGDDVVGVVGVDVVVAVSEAGEYMNLTLEQKSDQVFDSLQLLQTVLHL